VSDPSAHLAELVDVARRLIANARQRDQLTSQRARLFWRIVRVDGLRPREAAARIQEALTVAQFTPDEIREVGVSEANIRPIARLPREP
jgi:hypothetical protein